ncbi:conserved hypothetical protein [Coccidioides posadasii str. Silveira]|uniref:Uncharacterized protein n=1 Tax=Coccidioides posadasii (strain RMSCC 757 / Silveira) TaxID=443226 RepID=E9DIY1_COCPS|nr:conserved hypothetical protein [Coccidioides posadasii str. Silveira]
MTPSNAFQKGASTPWAGQGSGRQRRKAQRRKGREGGKGGSTRRQWVSSTEAPETSRSLLESFWKGLGYWPARDRSLGAGQEEPGGGMHDLSPSLQSTDSSMLLPGHETDHALRFSS